MLDDLKRLRLKVAEAVEFADDVARLRAILNTRGYDVDPADIALAHGRWSEDFYAAGWMELGTNEEWLFQGLMTQLEEFSDA